MSSEFQHLQKMQQLKPCPFCGGEAELKQSEPVDVEGRIWWRVLCKKPGCFANHNNLWNILPDEAIDAWNTRHERTCTVYEYEPAKHGVCSNCLDGIGLYDGWDVHKREYKNNYCPNCGARVVM